ncbi:unnamed protein product [Malus baccata var. baccata]
MRGSGFSPNQFTLPMVVASCAELMLLDHGSSVHGLAKKLGNFAGNSAVGSSFVHMYSKCGRMEDASLMFDEITVRDVVCWTALIIGYVQNDEGEKGLEYLCEMHRVGSIGERPNFRTLEVGLQACGDLGALVEGRCLHGFVVKSGTGCSGDVKSLLLSMYSRCGTPEESYLSFCDVENKDVISWTSVIGVYARSGLMTECLSLFREMHDSDIYPDEIVVSCVLSGFRNSSNVNEGKAFLGLVMRQNYALSQNIHSELLSLYCKFELLTLAEKLFSGMQHQSKESCYTMLYGYVANTLIDMYGKIGYLTIARRIFSRTQKYIITWNSLISSHTHNGHYFEAIALFHKMIAENFMPNSATLVTVLSACSHLASLEEGKKVHCYIKERHLEINLSLATALVDMYAKCGQLEKSREFFNSMEERDVISWNVMISGYATHGHAESAIKLFREMEDLHVKPNELTFLALLSACNHSGLVEEGKYLFLKMQDLSLQPHLKHYACMVGILGRSGKLQEAEDLVLSMPISPDGGVWGSLLGACKIHNEIELGVRVARHAIKSDPENDGYYIMLSNLYSSIGKWEAAINVRKMMEDKSIGKTKGWSVV